MNNLDAIFLNYLVIATTMILISSPGLFLLSSLSTDFMKSTSYVRICVAFTLGFASLILMTFLLGKLNFSPKIGLQILFFPSCAALGILFFKRKANFFINDIKVILLSSLVGAWQFIPGILRSDTNFSLLTHYNNDIAAYAGWTNEFLKTGFANSNHIASFNLNEYAMNSGLGTTTLLSYVASIFELEAWQVTTPAMGVCISMAVIGLSRLIQTFYPKINPNRAFIAAAIIMTTSFLTYIQLSYFLGQVISISISVILLSNVMEYSRSFKNAKFLCYEVSGLAVLAVACYPPFLIPFLTLCLTLFIIRWFSKNGVRENTSFLRYISFLGIGLILSIPYLRISIQLGETLGTGNFGWKLAPLNPLNIFLLPQTIGASFDATLTVVSWIVFILLVVFISKKSHLEFQDKFLTLAVIVLTPIFIIFGSILLNIGLDGYKSWKLQAYLFPIWFALVLPILTSSKKLGLKALVVGLCLTQSSSLLLWGSTPPVFVSQELQNLGKDVRLNQLKTLNIKLDPYFETTAAAAIVDGPQIFVNSATFYGTSTDPNGCVLVYLNDTTYPYVKPLNSIYGLASSKKDECSSLEPPLMIGKKIFFDSRGKLLLGSGWSSPEEWGTWTEGKQANLDLNVNVGKAKEITLYVESSAFLPVGQETQEVLVFANDRKVGQIRFTPADNLAERSFAVPINPSKGTIQKLKLRFEIAKPIAPSSLGAGGDSRELGMGLISITFR